MRSVFLALAALLVVTTNAVSLQIQAICYELHRDAGRSCGAEHGGRRRERADASRYAPASVALHHTWHRPEGILPARSAHERPYVEHLRTSRPHVGGGIFYTELVQICT